MGCQRIETFYSRVSAIGFRKVCLYVTATPILEVVTAAPLVAVGKELEVSEEILLAKA